MKAAFNKEKALGGAFSVIVQLHRLIVYSTTYLSGDVLTGGLQTIMSLYSVVIMVIII